MMNEIPLVGSMTAGFGAGGPTAPTVKTPNIEEASKDFVSMLYSYMFQQMRESGSDEEEGLFSGPHVNMLMGFLDQEVGKKLAHSEGKGLADSLLTQLQGNNAAQSEAEQVATLANVGNTIKEMTTDDVSLESEADTNQQMMDELYKLNQ